MITKAIIEECWTVTSSQAVNAALNDLSKQEIIAKKHTGRNYFKLAKNVVFTWFHHHEESYTPEGSSWTLPPRKQVRNTFFLWNGRFIRTKSVVDVNIIRQLELSRNIVGEFNSVINDWDGEVLSGSHRNQAGWKKTHKIDSRALAK